MSSVIRLRLILILCVWDTHTSSSSGTRAKDEERYKMDTIDPIRVRDIFRECQLKEEDGPVEGIPADGTTLSAVFHSGRLDEHRSEILEMLQLLPYDFQEESRGGGSLSSAALDRFGNAWTRLIQDPEMLILLGLATGYARSVYPIGMWDLTRNNPLFWVAC